MIEHYLRDGECTYSTMPTRRGLKMSSFVLSAFHSWSSTQHSNTKGFTLLYDLVCSEGAKASSGRDAAEAACGRTKRRAVRRGTAEAACRRDVAKGAAGSGECQALHRHLRLVLQLRLLLCLGSSNLSGERLSASTCRVINIHDKIIETGILRTEHTLTVYSPMVLMRRGMAESLMQAPGTT